MRYSHDVQVNLIGFEVLFSRITQNGQAYYVRIQLIKNLAALVVLDRYNYPDYGAVLRQLLLDDVPCSMVGSAHGLFHV